MNKQHQLTLIDGEFSPQEACDVVGTLLQSKINFHNGRALSLQERFGYDPAHSRNRVLELKATDRELRELVAYAERNNLQLSIDGTIKITVHAAAEVGVGAE